MARVETWVAEIWVAPKKPTLLVSRDNCMFQFGVDRAKAGLLGGARANFLWLDLAPVTPCSKYLGYHL